MHYEIMTVTPELAQRWLSEKNTRNRNISPKKVNSYADDMKFNRWHATHQNAIAFYKDGNLADGQHRLSAIVVSGVSIELMVWWGLDDKSAYGIDAHRMRKTDDQIKIAGGADWINKDIVACARMLMPETKDRSSVASAQKIVEFCEDHKNALIFSVDRLPKGAATAPVRAAVAAAFYSVPNSVLSNWCNVMRTGIGENKTARTVLTLRERLIREPALRSGSGTNREYALRLAMRSIQAYNDEKVLTKLYEPKGRIYEIAA